jgi:hypothetical protein
MQLMNPSESPLEANSLTSSSTPLTENTPILVWPVENGTSEKRWSKGHLTAVNYPNIYTKTLAGKICIIARVVTEIENREYPMENSRLDGGPTYELRVD